MDKKGNADIIDYSRLKSKIVAHSVLVTGLFAMVHGFNLLSIFLLTFNTMLDYGAPLSVYTDSPLCAGSTPQQVPTICMTIENGRVSRK